MSGATALLTLVALLSFAANSLLTRAALAPLAIDPTLFAAVRLGAGAVMLAALVHGAARRADARRRTKTATGADAPAAAMPSVAQPTTAARWVGPLALLLYAVPFTIAYVRLGAATGALLLFATVQLAMLGASVWRGERVHTAGWLGALLALAGLVVLVGGAAARLEWRGAVLMIVAGVAWAGYTLAGRGAAPLVANARSFAWSAPAAALCWLVLRGPTPTTMRGVALAIVSGAVTSALGYAIWYRAVAGLTATQAAVLQVSVPVLAALGAVLLLDEPLSGRLVLAGTLVLAGVLLVVRDRRDAGR